MKNNKDKILIIGVGAGGREIAKSMHDGGIDNASFITFGNYSGEDECK